MLFHIEFLRFRRGLEKTPIQMCWCAATTKNFVGVSDDKNKVSKEDIANMTISSVCDTVIGGLHSRENETRMSLYMASQLMYGVSRIFKQQADLVTDLCELMLNSILSTEPENQTKKKENTPRNREENRTEMIEDLLFKSPKVINLEKAFPSLTPEDTHLMEEIDYPSHAGFAALSFDFPNDITMSFEELEVLQQELISETPECTGPVKDVEETIPARLNVDLDAEPNSSKKMEEQTQWDVSLNTSGAAQKSKACRKRPQKVTEQLKDMSLESMRAAHPSPSKKIRQPASASSDILPNNPPNQLEDELDPIEVSEAIYEAALPDCLKRGLSVEDERSESQIQSMGVSLEPRISADLDDTQPVVTPDSDLYEADHPENYSLEQELAKLEVPASCTTSLDSCAASKLNHPNTLSKNMSPEQMILTKERKGSRFMKKQFADQVKQILLVERPLKSLKKPWRKMNHKKESINSLFLLPASLKKKFYHISARLWSEKLHQNFRKNVEFLKLHAKENEFDGCQMMEEMSEKENETPGEHESSDFTIKDIRIVLERIRISDISVNTESFQDKLTHSRIDHISYHMELENRIMQDEREDESSSIYDQNHDHQPTSDNRFGLAFLQNEDVDLSQRLFSNTELNRISSESEVYCLIKELWLDENHAESERDHRVSFEDVFPPWKIDSIGVIRHLMHCFNLERERKLELYQEEPYRTLFIVPPQEHRLI